MRHRHWQRLSSRTAADKGNKTSGLRTSSSSLSLYTDDDLQNNQKHSKQLILVFFFLVHGFVCFRFGFAFLLVSPSSLFQEAAWRMGFYRRRCSYWWPIYAKESGSREARVMALWCATGGWSVGTVEAGLAERGKTAASRESKKKRESAGSRGLRWG